jgi:hypothetical protein
MSFIFSVIPDRPRAAAPGDLLFRTIVNRSVLLPLTIVPDQDLRFPLLVNISDVRHLRITTGDDFNIEFPIIVNSSSFPTLEIQEAPPDGNIILPLIENASELIVFEIQEAPPDGIIRFPTLVNVSTIGSLAIVEDVIEIDDEGEGIGMSPIGGSVI